MSLSDLPSELGERGIWWQVAGFAIVGGVSVAVLQIWEGSNFWVYRSFEIAAKDLYWLFILPLAGAIEGARKMFEKASEIRAAQTGEDDGASPEPGARGRTQGRAKGRQGRDSRPPAPGFGFKRRNNSNRGIPKPEP